MDCLDCLLDTHRHIVAVACCSDCGAGVCLTHLVILERRLTRPAVMLREIPVDPPARVLRCPTCHAAHQAQLGQPVAPQRTASGAYAERRPVVAGRG